jgi:hypothetical protein
MSSKAKPTTAAPFRRRSHRIDPTMNAGIGATACSVLILALVLLARLVSAGRAADPLVTIGFEQQLQRVSIVLIVIDDKDTGEIRCHQYLELFSIG